MKKRSPRPPKARSRRKPARAAAPRAPAISLAAAGFSDVGRRRGHNEDAFRCEQEGGSGLFIVADGMGGKAAGEAASRAVVTVLPPLLQQVSAQVRHPTPVRLQETLGGALRRLSRDLFHQSQSLPALAGLGSTAAVLWIRDGIGCVGYAGDSRIYLLRGGRLERLSEDQTTAMALVKLGNLPPAEAERHPLSNSLEEYIGKENALNPGTRYRRLRRGDRFLLCSDGLTKGLVDEEIRRVLRGASDPEAASRDLVAAANAADGSDNITALVVDVQ